MNIYIYIYWKLLSIRKDLPKDMNDELKNKRKRKKKKKKNKIKKFKLKRKEKNVV